jgi:amino acid adenylation domain-containing protein/thioester reductase-like protein
VECNIQEAETVAVLQYQTSLLTEEQAMAIADTFRVAVSAITEYKRELAEISLLGDQDKEKIYGWNAVAPGRTGRCVHELIQERCVQQPETLAVCAWDGDFTYHQLIQLASTLAAHLVGLGVGPEVFIPICLEKSRWAAVAMLGVMKAGGAIVLLDPSQPLSRLQQICREVTARVILASTKTAAMATSLSSQVVVLGDNEKEWLESDTSLMPTSVTPENALYAIFTSGSTGTPKGVVIEHATFYSTVSPYSQALHLNNDSRIFQFASYAFDVTIFDTLITFIVGGCVCVPSDTDRWSDVTNTIEHFQVSHVSLTPTVARLLHPPDLPTLKTVALGGEKLATSDVARWDGYARIVNLYGASECPIMSIQCRTTRGSGPREINYPTGSVAWIVDPQNHEKLLPIGAVGELLVEGPVVGRGYLNNPEKTAATFVPMPSWMQRFRGEDHSHRVYKAGDLVSYKADGSLRFVGRKDTQVKLRGQRVELGEVEHHLRQAFPDAADVIAEVVTPIQAERPPMLVAFIAYGTFYTAESDHNVPSTIFAEPTEEFSSRSDRARSRLQDTLPAYMVPAVFLPLVSVPFTKTSKVDRMRLRKLAAALPRAEVERYNMLPGSRRPPATEMEKSLQRYFAEVLHIPLEQVGADDHFFSRGGDSLTAMRLVAMARKDMSNITVKDVFDHPRLSALASIIGFGLIKNEPVPEPFSLLGKSDMQQAIAMAADQCQVAPTSIEDIYPCTPLQEGLMALSVQDIGASFVADVAFSVPADLDLKRLEAAWNSVADANPIMRTRIILSDLHGMLQVVIRENIEWTTRSTSVNAHNYRALLGRRLVHFVVSPLEGNPEANYELAVFMHHAVYDGWTLPLLLQEVQAAYHGQTPSPKPFSPFIRYLVSVEGEEEYWKSVTANMQGTAFPALPTSIYQPAPRTVTSLHETINTPIYKEFTANTYIQLAWGLTQAQVSGSHDVCYGAVVSGRNAAVPGIEQLTAPTIATVPRRIIFDVEDPVKNALQKVQTGILNCIPFEQTGLQNIRRYSPDAALACSFQTLLVVQPDITSDTYHFLKERKSARSHHAWVTYPLTVICNFDGRVLGVDAVFDCNVVRENEMRCVLTHFTHVLRRLYESPWTQIKDLMILPPFAMPSPEPSIDSKAFWEGEFGEVAPPTFPPLPSVSYEVSANKSLERHFDAPPVASSRISTETLLLASWGLLQARYVTSAETVVGCAFGGSEILPFKVQVIQDQTIQAYLESVQSRSVAMLSHQSYDLQNIARLGAGPAAACAFQSLLTIRRGFTAALVSKTLWATKALSFEVTITPSGIVVKAHFDANVISYDSVTRLMLQFEHIMAQLGKESMIMLADVEMASPRDKEDVFLWNQSIDPLVEDTVHSLVQRQVEYHPDRQAICSWDGDMTYAQLDRVSSKLAGYLMKMGIGRETYIPLCFEKSLWTIVAMVSVMKAGGAFVPLDPSAPVSRLKAMVDTVQATIILSSREQYDRHPHLAQTTVVVDASWEDWLTNHALGQSSSVTPADAAYVIFTSGSTGTPKGIVVEHGAFCTAGMAHKMGLSLGTRVLQFSSYAFDVSLGEILSTLMHGGCVCIPSDDERRDNIAAAINRMEVDYAFLTPSFASTLDPRSVPTLRTLCLAGEAMSETVLRTWAPHVLLVNGYGPAECCVISSANRGVTIGSHPANIGTAVGGACWVVDPDNDQKLSPVGAIGELLIEGHNVARCYIGQPEMTRAAFISAPTWLPFDRCDHLYKTGDLVQYRPDGSLVFIDRKDTQVKIRGQRVELGEIEHHITVAAGGNASSVIVAYPRAGTLTRKLVAILEPASRDGCQRTVLAPISQHHLHSLDLDLPAIVRSVKERLPFHMVPNEYIVVEKLPTSLSAKLDRKSVDAWLVQSPPGIELTIGGIGHIASDLPLLRTDETVAIAISNRVAALANGDSTVRQSLEGRDYTIAAAGLDSIQAISLVTYLRDTHSLHTTVRKILDGTMTVRSLAALVAGEDNTGSDSNTIDVMHEASRFVESVYNQSRNARPSGQVVFLTGCTSLLGTEILHQLCGRPDVSKVIVHVRASTPQDALVRCKDAAIRARWWEETHRSKIEAWAGDLAQPQLGLTGEQWACLTGTRPDGIAINGIIHAGAAVNWTAGYKVLRAVNVHSTVDLVRAAVISPAQPRLVFISGGHTWRLDETDASLADQVASSNGYSQSKFVAEMVVKRFAEKSLYAEQFSIIKPGLIIGTPEEGVPNADDYLWRLTAAAVDIGLYSADGLDTRLWITSSSRVAEEAIQNALSPPPQDRRVVYVTDGVTMSEYWDTVNESLGNRLTSIPHGSWLSRIDQAIETSGTNHPLWPVREIFHEVRGRFGGERFSGMDVNHRKHHVKAAIRKNVTFLAEVGFMSEPRGKGLDVTHKLFRRTGDVWGSLGRM